MKAILHGQRPRESLKWWIMPEEIVTRFLKPKDDLIKFESKGLTILDLKLS